MDSVVLALADSLSDKISISGIVFSGANREASGGFEDGFLTAEEIEELDLSRARLVVLSACDTGLGEERVGEGLLGLRRAFGIAGARSVVASLWKVGDLSTTEWMKAFYASWLPGRSSVPQSVQAASRAVL